MVSGPENAISPSMRKVGEEAGLDLLMKEIDEAGIDPVVARGRATPEGVGLQLHSYFARARWNEELQIAGNLAVISWSTLYALVSNEVEFLDETTSDQQTLLRLLTGFQ